MVKKNDLCELSVCSQSPMKSISQGLYECTKSFVRLKLISLNTKLLNKGVKYIDWYLKRSSSSSR